MDSLQSDFYVKRDVGGSNKPVRSNQLKTRLTAITQSLKGMKPKVEYEDWKVWISFWIKSILGFHKNPHKSVWVNLNISRVILSIREVT